MSLIQKLSEMQDQSLFNKYMNLDKNQRDLWNTAYKCLELGYYNTKDFWKFCHSNNLPLF